jgi:hypothetical protein
MKPQINPELTFGFFYAYWKIYLKIFGKVIFLYYFYHVIKTTNHERKQNLYFRDFRN